LASFIGILEPNEGFAVHMKKGHPGTMIQRNLVIVKKLVGFVSPSCWVIAIKAWKIQTHGTSMDRTLLMRNFWKIVIKEPTLTTILMTVVLLLVEGPRKQAVILIEKNPWVVSGRVLWRWAESIAVIRWRFWRMALISENYLDEGSEVVDFLGKVGVEYLLLSPRVLTFLDRFSKLRKTSTFRHGNVNKSREKKKICGQEKVNGEEQWL
jgi:hypothetical protein